MHKYVWNRNERKRVAVLATLVALAGVLGLWAAGQPWVAASLSGAPSCPAVSSGATVQVVNALGQVETIPDVATCTTLYSEAAVQAATAAQGSVGIGSLAPTIPVTAGIPSFVFWLGLAAAIALVGAAIRNALVAAPALLVWSWSFTAYSSSVASMTTGLLPGQVATQYGLTLAQAGMWLVAIAAAGVTLAIAVANRRARAEAAAEDGRETWSLDSVRDLSSAVLRLSREAGRKASEEAK